jgi:hypothetical protein
MIALTGCFFWLLTLGVQVTSAATTAADATSNREIQPYYAIRPHFACVYLMDDKSAIVGGPFTRDAPWLVLGEGEGRYLLHRAPSELRRVDSDDLMVEPVDTASGSCPDN